MAETSGVPLARDRECHLDPRALQSEAVLLESVAVPSLELRWRFVSYDWRCSCFVWVRVE